MPLFPVRGIAKGVITDVDPYNLPIGAWSMGLNVRFRNESITRGPVLRTALTSLAYSSPRYLAADVPSSGYDSIILGYLNGRVTSVVAGAETDVSISGYSNSDSEAVFTSCFLGDVFYINRSDRSPWALPVTSTAFEVLPNWAPVSGPWTCNILRASNSALCAYGITQDGVYYPTMVITSEFALEGAVPATWDYTLGTNNATQNTLDEIEGPITDVCALGNSMVIYGQNQTWLQYFSNDVNIWNYEQLFGDVGAISANCAVEVDKKHYVFGLNDIWVHDGVAKLSICDEKTREFIFNNLNVSAASRCSVAYNKNLKELNFRYVSGDAYTHFLGTSATQGCNRQATYHIPTHTWSFDDLPYVYGAAMANLDNIATWSNVPGDWDTIGGAWLDQEDSAQKILVMVGDVNATYSVVESVYAYDLSGPGSIVSLAIDSNASQPATLIRDGIDLDEVGADLRGYKSLSSIYPRCRLQAGAAALSFSFGSADYFNEAVVMSDPQTYDGSTLYKLDYNASGRYLFMQMTQTDTSYFNLTGFDFDLDVLGEY